MADLFLKPGREKAVLRRHPWIFSGAVREVLGQPAPGETVEVRDASGRFLARAAYSPRSQIVARIWTWEEGEQVDAGFLERRVRAAISSPYRSAAVRIPHQALRLVNAESDGLPGLIVDFYSGFIILQSLTAGSERWKPEIVSLMQSLLSPVGIYERSDVSVREKEGLERITGRLAGEEPPRDIEVEEYGSKFRVDVRAGHKTGWYLDQRENRRLIRMHASGRETLDVFSYTGGFTISALKGGAASVLSVDSSAGALAALREHLTFNRIAEGRAEQLEGDAFRVLRQMRDSGRQFDLIVLDPPKFAHSAGQVERAARGYKDLNLLAFKLLRPGGVLFTFSCSGAVSLDLFQKIVAGAALDADVHAQIVRRLTQASDHPVALNFPEAEYLKGLVCLLPK